jgi:hypothetical protein
MGGSKGIDDLKGGKSGCDFGGMGGLEKEFYVGAGVDGEIDR